MNGTGTTLVLDTAQLEMAKKDGTFEQYAHISPNVTNIFLMWFNENRQTYANVADGACALEQDRRAEGGQPRRAAEPALPSGSGLLHRPRELHLQSLGEDLKYVCLRNSYVPGNFVTLEEDVTVDINGASQTFEAGTFYGEIVQAQIDADGYPFQVWDEESHSSDGFDGWYNVENAVAELQLAIEELAAMGYEVSEDNPIVLDYPYSAYNEIASNQAVVLKTSIENALNGLLRLPLSSARTPPRTSTLGSTPTAAPSTTTTLAAWAA